MSTWNGHFFMVRMHGMQPASVYIQGWPTMTHFWRKSMHHGASTGPPNQDNRVIRSMKDLLFIPTGRFVMLFTDIAQGFSNGLTCTDAYDGLKSVCLQLSRTDPDNAATYFFVSGFARSYVLLYEEEAVPTELAQRAKLQMNRYLEILSSALADGSAQARLSALNAVVLDYLQSDRIF